MESATLSGGGHDAVALAGAIGSVPKLFDPTGKTLVVNYGGAMATFMLDKNGHAHTANGTAALKFKPSLRNKATKKMEFQGGNVSFTIKLVNGVWAGVWGLDPSATVSTTMNMTVSMTLDGSLYDATTTLKYTSKANVGGKFVKK
jgi:hypothetical protein